jgi:phenylacetate-CoA ligase
MFANLGYKIAPPRLQEALIAARARIRAILREGKAFRKMLAQLQETQWLEGDALSAYHEANLRALLTHAATHVPFYRELAKPGDALVDSSPHRLDTWPLLDKSLVRQAGQRLLSDTARRPLFEGSTSGTTGTPLALLQDLQAVNRENAFIWRQLQWAGFTPGTRRAWIRGDLIVPVGDSKPPFWRRNRAENMLMLSSYHLSEPNASVYLEALAHFDPVVIQAYPSSIGFLAAYLDATGRHYEGTALKGVVTSSESVGEGCIPVLWHLDSRQPQGTHRPGTHLWEPRVVRARAGESSVEQHCQ